ncbi:hypothetical protein [Streptomyces hygroscopicus]|nr:hypothetical protein [Streptomyces sp. NBRC 109436]
MSAIEPPAQPQEAQQDAPKPPTQQELDERADALNQRIDKHLGRGGADPMTSCATCTRLKQEKAKAMEAGDYRLAADLELKIRHHPDGHKMPPFGPRWGWIG